MSNVPGTAPVLTLAVAIAVGGSIAQPVPGLAQAPGVVWRAATDPPPPPPGTTRVVNYDRNGKRLAACAEKAGSSIQVGGRSVPATEVWITDGDAVWKTSIGAATCDPAWSPDGQRLVVSAPDGLWLLSGPQQRAGERLVDARRSDQGANGAGNLVLSKPRWSPNGARVAYVASSGGATFVEAVDVGTGRLIWKSGPETYAFTWGADSRSLVIGGNTVRIP